MEPKNVPSAWLPSKAVLVFRDGCYTGYSSAIYGGLASEDVPLMYGDSVGLGVTADGFQLLNSRNCALNLSGYKYSFAVLRENRENPRGNFPRGSFYVKSNRGDWRLLGDVAVNVNEDCNNVLSSVVVLEYDVSILGALNAIILDCAVVISSLVIIAAT